MGHVKIDLSGCKLSENFYSNKEGYSWNALTLVDAAKDLEEFDLPLAGIDLGVGVWSGVETIKGFTKHVKRIVDTDLKYPILLGEDGNIVDGWHRAVKAIILGRKTIKAKRFQVRPDCDRYKSPKEE